MNNQERLMSLNGSFEALSEVMLKVDIKEIQTFEQLKGFLIAGMEQIHKEMTHLEKHSREN